jgi:hypothetical protein
MPWDRFIECLSSWTWRLLSRDRDPWRRFRIDRATVGDPERSSGNDRAGRLGFEIIGPLRQGAASVRGQGLSGRKTVPSGPPLTARLGGSDADGKCITFLKTMQHLFSSLIPSVCLGTGK